MTDIQRCTLCKTPDATPKPETGSATYLQCHKCGLVFLHPDNRLPPDEEVKRYNRHENYPGDAQYRKFLGRLFDPINDMIPPGSSGLDFGSGPGPTLHLMFEEAGHRMEIYDPFYADNVSVFDHTYDFITSTEVFEHLFHPREELHRLRTCLRPNGFLGVMTKRVPDHIPFSEWHYISDDTHVTFWSDQTFRWLADQWNATLSFHGGDVAILKTGS